MNIKISIIVSVKNSEKTLDACIQSLLALNYDNYEIIFINDGSTDRTAEILKKYDRVKVIETNGVGPSKARNIGIEKSKGQYIAFTDADCIVDKEWLNELLNGFTDTDNVAAVGGDQKSPDDDSNFGKKIHQFFKTIGFIADYVKNTSGLVATKHNPTCNVMYKKDVLTEVGGFLENLWPGEDLELDYRLNQKGYKLLYNPKALVYHYRTNSLKGFFKMMFNYGWAQGVLVRKYGFFRLIHVLPVILSFILLCVLIDFSAIFSIILLAAGACIYISRKNIANIVSNSLFLLFAVIFWNLGFAKGVFVSIPALDRI